MNYQQNQRLAQAMAQFQPVQNGGLAGALAQGLAGFGSGYFGGQAVNQQNQVRTKLAEALAKGDTTGAMSLLATSGIPEYENMGLKSQLDLAEKDAESKRKQAMLKSLGFGDFGGTETTATGGTETTGAKLAAASVVYPELAPLATFMAGQEKQNREDNKFPDTQATASGYANRMAKAEQELQLFEGRGYSPANDPQSYFGSGIPGVGNYIKDPQYQQYEQAASDWIRAKLRKESGAVIGKEEMAQEFKQYFPVPGDTPEVVAQKARSRAEGFNQMVVQSGNAYKTQFGGLNPYAPTGDIAKPSTPTQAAQPAQPAGADANISGALQAIQSGAPRDAVKSRLLQNGYTQEQLKAAGL